MASLNVYEMVTERIIKQLETGNDSMAEALDWCSVWCIQQS